jgi:hypothetical protein
MKNADVSRGLQSHPRLFGLLELLRPLCLARPRHDHHRILARRPFSAALRRRIARPGLGLCLGGVA